MSSPASYGFIFQSILKNQGMLLRTEAKPRAVVFQNVVCFLLSLYLLYNVE